MATTTINSSTVVFSNSTAAANMTLTGTDDTSREFSFDVLGASGGGAKTTIYSVDDGVKGDDNAFTGTLNKGFENYNTDLLFKDTAVADGSGTTETTAKGNKFWIGTDGKIHFKLADSVDINSIEVGSNYTDTFQYTIKMSNGTLSVGTLSVVVTNTEDGPTISAHTDGAVTEDDSNPDLTDSGTITFDDADLLDVHTVSNGAADAANTLGGTLTASITDTATGAGNGTVTWNYSVANSTTQSLAEGETVHEKFTVTISDGHTGGTVDQVIDIVVTGVNDVADITDQAGGDFNVTEDGDLGAGGTLLVSDADHDQSAFKASETSNAIAGGEGHGTFTWDAATGAWTYLLNNDDPALDTLDDGQSLTDTLTIHSVDGTEHTVTVNIHGADESVTPPDEGNPPVVVATPVDPDVTGDPNDNDGLGSAGHQTINASDTSGNTYYGGAGDDTLNGGKGTDTLYGGSGDDALNGNKDIDTIYGGSGIDTINGGEAGDVIVGGWSADIINVADGNDVVKFLSILDTGDKVSGFGAGDALDFSAIDATSGGGDDAFTLTAGTGVVAHGINYFQDGADTKVWVDTDGVTGTVEMEIVLVGVNVTDVHASNFVL